MCSRIKNYQSFDFSHLIPVLTFSLLLFAQVVFPMNFLILNFNEEDFPNT